MILTDVHYYKCSICQKTKAVEASGLAAEVTCTVKKLVTGLDQVAQSSQIGEKDQMLAVNSEARSRAIKME